MRRVLAVGSCLFALATASCAAIFGFERLTEGPLDDADGSTAAPDGAPADAGVDPRCLTTGYPTAPTEASGGTVTVIGALSLLDFGIGVDGGAGTIYGYNIDSTCSPTVATSSCKTNVTPSTFAAYGADKTGTGLDNSAFSLIAYISSVSDTFGAAAINEGLQAGHYGAVVRVTLWNGQPDDDNVAVEVFPTNGFASGAKPTFGPADVWRLDQRFQLGSGLDYSKEHSLVAYVRGGQLVAHFPELTLEMLIGDDSKPFDITLEDAVLTGQVSSDADAGVLSGGVVAGRWQSAKFLKQVREIYVKDGNGIKNSVLCDGNPLAIGFYDQVKQNTCDGRDVRADLKDNAGLPCDAISAAAHVEGYRVNDVGTWWDGGVFAPRCVDSGIADDDCTSN